MKLTTEQSEALKDAVAKPFVSEQWVRGRKAIRTTDQAFLDELAAAEKLLTVQNLFRDLCKQHFGYKYEKANEREGVCVVTGETVPANKGILVKQGGVWKVYSRKGALQQILADAEIN